ncbi:MAG: serine/threonine protein phosphatase, partial [Mesorhizobium sp.]
MPASAEPPPLSASAAAEPYGRVVLRAALWLAFLAPFFYSTYGLANWLASTRRYVGSIVFS